MRRFLTISLALPAALALAALVGAAPAGAAVVVGSDLSMPPAGSFLCPGPAASPPISCTTAISFLPAGTQASGGYRAGSDGVVVAWSVRTGNSAIEHSVRLRVVRNNTGAGTGAIETLPKGQGVYTYAARLPIGKDDFIGIDSLNNPELQGTPIIRTFTGSAFDFWNALLLDDETRSPTTNEAVNLELLINATIEPDADHDGYGDETQDKCAGKTDPTNACPADPGGGGGVIVCDLATSGCPPPASVPNTKLGQGGPKGPTNKTKATFRFSATVAGSIFHCKLDKKPWKVCKSPKTYSGLKEGRHSFKVRAVGASGLIDPTPAKRSFKVEP